MVPFKVFYSCKICLCDRPKLGGLILDAEYRNSPPEWDNGKGIVKTKVHTEHRATDENRYDSSGAISGVGGV